MMPHCPLETINQLPVPRANEAYGSIELHRGKREGAYGANANAAARRENRPAGTVREIRR